MNAMNFKPMFNKFEANTIVVNRIKNNVRNVENIVYTRDVFGSD